jgi:hypothetical protein
MGPDGVARRTVSRAPGSAMPSAWSRSSTTSGRFRRAAGDRYSEMVSLVQDSRVSDGLGRLVGELCVRRGCDHRLVRAA